MLVLTKLFIVIGVLTILNFALLTTIIMVSWRSCSSEQSKAPNMRIIGGVGVDIKYYPFAAAIVIRKHASLDSDRLQCGSSIISKKWVVTAAHCLVLLEEQRFTRRVVYISAGHARWDKGYKHTVIAWAYHENYDQSIMSDDIGLIRVRELFINKNERPIPLASIKYKYQPGRKVRVSGWGVTTLNGKISDTLNAVDVFLFKQSYCVYLYGEYALAMIGIPHQVTDSMVCAGTKEGGKDACQFDSGGGLFDHGLLIGIVSWGVECAVKAQPGVYTRVHLYKQWIVNTTKKLKAPLYIINPNDPKPVR